MPARHTVRLGDEAMLDERALTAGERKFVLAVLRDVLPNEPERKTRNRDRTRPPHTLGQWRLRAQPWRVYYDVDGDTIWVRAILYKPRETAYRRGKEITIDE